MSQLIQILKNARTQIATLGSPDDPVNQAHLRELDEEIAGSDQLTFGELEIGDYFIGFPLSGDNEGHGGYRGASNLFVKTSVTEAGRTSRARSEGARSMFPASMPILKVLL